MGLLIILRLTFVLTEDMKAISSLVNNLPEEGRAGIMTSYIISRVEGDKSLINLNRDFHKYFLQKISKPLYKNKFLCRSLEKYTEPYSQKLSKEVSDMVKSSDKVSSRDIIAKVFRARYLEIRHPASDYNERKDCSSRFAKYMDKEAEMAIW